MDNLGQSLPWDNTNRRLGRPGPGVPFTRLSGKLAKTHEWDAKGNFVCKKS